MVYDANEVRKMSDRKFKEMVKQRHLKFARARDDDKDNWEHNLVMIDAQDSIKDIKKFIELLDIEIMGLLELKEQSEARISIIRSGRA